MSFVLNKKGERVHVDMDTEWFSQTVPLYDDDAELFDIYILNLYKSGKFNESHEIELVTQVELRKKPTKEEIMYHMWKNGLSRYDVATVETGYILDWNDRT